MLRAVSALVATVAGVLLGGCSLTQDLDALQGSGSGTGSGGAGGSSTSSQSTTSSAVGGAGGGGGAAVCANDCLGGECLAGRCQPVVLWQGTEGGRSTGLALEGDDVYWLSTDGLYRMPKVGGEAQRLGDGDGIRLIVVGSSLFFTRTTGLYQQSTLGGIEVEVQTGNLRGLVSNGEYVYYVDSAFGDDGLWTHIIAEGGQAVPIVPMPASTFGDPFAIAIHDNSIFTTSTEGAYRYDTVSDALVPVFSGGGGQSLTFFGDDMFVLDAGLWRVGLASADDVEEIADAQDGQLARDNTHVYFTSTSDGRVGRVDFAGNQPEILFEDAEGADVIAVDDTAIYYTHFLDNRVMRLAK